MHESDSRLKLQRRRARGLFRRAYRAHERGDIDCAIDLYNASIRAHPTAEAYTFLGWAHFFRQDYKTAVSLCQRAIDLDPEFGNPYNDIGAYLIEMGRWNEAEPWLQAAARARRYRAYHYPWYNLGRLYEHRFEWERAEAHYRRSLAISPGYSPARKALLRLQARRN